MKIIDVKNYGFVIAPRDENAYVLGGGMLEKIILQPDGQWDECLPETEMQFESDFDTANCTGFGTTSAIEILFKKLYYI